MVNIRWQRTARIARATLIGATLAWPLAGCNVLGPAIMLVEGPPKVEAKTKLDKARTHVVFVDDRRSQLPRRSLRRAIGQTCEETLIARKVLNADAVVPSRTAMQVASSESFDSLLSLEDIGVKVGAEVVIYIDVQRWTLSRDGVTLTPTAQAGIKVFDSVEARRLWPLDQEAWPLVVALPIQSQGHVPTDRNARAELEEGLAQTLGLEAAKLFFTYEVRSVQSGAFQE